MRLLARSALAVAALLSTTTLALGQPSAPAEAEECGPGFRQFVHRHGEELNFTCRTRVLRCPEREGYFASIVPDRPLELQMGVQFSYRCHYTSIVR